MENKVYKLGVRSEEFSKWERRVCLTPQHCKSLLFKMKDRLVIKVQPSASRIYTDNKYEEVGCLITEDISDCDLILGVKQIPKDKLYPNCTYMFFSHTIKAQEQNMEMLDDILEKKIRLIDYEKISDCKNQRLVAFGTFAGNAGVIDIFSGLGGFLLNKGIGTPFINISQSYHYLNIEHAKSSIRIVGNAIESAGLFHGISPFIVGVTGTGRCSQGAMEILTLFPHEIIEPSQLDYIFEDAKKYPHKHNKSIYIVQFTHEHLVQLREPNGQPFSKDHYYKNPELYHNIFQKTYLKYLSVLVNCIYWDDRFPRLVTERYLKKTVTEENPLRLLAISDVTCDYMGSIDFLKKFTTIDYPFFVFNPMQGTINDNYKEAKSGILYLSVENLPSQFPLDASNHFSNQLRNFIPPILESDITKKVEEQNLPLEISKAVITHNGHLTNLFTYIKKLRAENDEYKKKGLKEVEEYRKEENGDQIHLYLEGHLFDTRAINDILDIIVDRNHINCTIAKWNVGFGEQNPSSCVLIISDPEKFKKVYDDIAAAAQSKNIKIHLIDEKFE